VSDILQSKKYRGLDLCEATLHDLVAAELPRHKRKHAAIKVVKRSLHNIVATYLGDPDYNMAEMELTDAFCRGDIGIVRATCVHIMTHHSSTRERLSLLPTFYQRIFKETGIPRVLLDIACGLNPLAFLWMDLPNSVEYHAYDIRRERVHMLNRYFELQGLQALARTQDVLVDVPQEKGDVALILKEAHRFEQRSRGSTRRLLDALQVRFLVVSFPRVNLSGQRDLAFGYRELLHRIVSGSQWAVGEIPYAQELVFIIDKQPGVEVAAL